MIARMVIPWVAAVAVGTLALVWSGRFAGAAASSLDRARVNLAYLEDQAAELGRLQSLAPRDPQRPALPEELPRRVSGVIRACGLPVSAMSSFDAAGVSREGDIITRRASLVLNQATLPQIGRFLAAWRSTEPHWTAASIEVAPRGDPPAAGGDLPLQAVITLESTIHALGSVP